MCPVRNAVVRRSVESPRSSAETPRKPRRLGVGEAWQALCESPPMRLPAMPVRLHDARVREAVALTSLLGLLVVAGFVLFPGCAGRCCDEQRARAEAPAAPPMPEPKPSAGSPAAAAPASGTASPSNATVAASVAPSAAADARVVGEPDTAAAAHIHNYFRLSPRLASGASPEGDEDFAALEAAGIKSIVTVDGAKPDAEGARKHGM